MRVEVTHGASDAEIRWWPYAPDDPFLSFASWSVIKRVDTTAETMPLPVEPAFIVPGTRPAQHTLPADARAYMAILEQAAELAEGLDEAILKREHFSQVRVMEWPKEEIRIEGYPWNEPDHWHVAIAIPDQSEYRAQA